MKNVLILGAAGRDFHNFNVVFRNHPGFRVVGFTATQIPGIASRRYPATLAGPGYPDGIPIFPEDTLERLIHQLNVDAVVFSYSDISHQNLMHLASRAVAAGARERRTVPFPDSPASISRRESEPVWNVNTPNVALNYSI